MSNPTAIPSVSVTYAQDGTSTKANALENASDARTGLPKARQQYLLIGVRGGKLSPSAK